MHSIKMKKLLVPGSHFGKSNNECVVAVFHYGSYSKWLLGNIFLQNYYFVFDMTPQNENKLNYIQVGIAKRNQLNEIGKIYDQEDVYIPGDQSSHV